MSLCGQSTYPNTVLTIKAGTATVSHTIRPGECGSFSGALTSTTAIGTANVQLKGATFYPGNEHRWYTKETTLGFTPPPTVAPAAPATRSYNLSSRGASRSLGNAQGTITATRGQKAATYEVKLCGQSTYPNTSVAIKAGSKTVSHFVGAGDCTTFTGTIESTTAICSATITVEGGTFDPGNTYRRYPTSTTVSF